MAVNPIPPLCPKTTAAILDGFARIYAYAETVRLAFHGLGPESSARSLQVVVDLLIGELREVEEDFRNLLNDPGGVSTDSQSL